MILKKDKTILFVGAFLSDSRGTLGPIESLFAHNQHEDIKFNLVSKYSSRLPRLLDIGYAILKTRKSVVHIDVYSGNAFMICEFAALLAKLNRNKLILNLHGGMLYDFSKTNSNRFKKLFRKAHEIICPSNFLIEKLSYLGFKIKYQPNSIQLNHFPFQLKTNIEFKLLWVRSFKAIYNPELAVRVFAFVKEKYPNASLTMVGPDGGLLDDCMRLADGLNLQDSITTLGKVDNKKLYRLYHTHDVFLNTTAYESFGVAVLEAMACGIPVVSTKVGELPFLWRDGEEILYCHDAKPEIMADTVVKLLGDEPLRQQISLNARKRAELFDHKSIYQNWLSHFNRWFQ